MHMNHHHWHFVWWVCQKQMFQTISFFPFLYCRSVWFKEKYAKNVPFKNSFSMEEHSIYLQAAMVAKINWKTTNTIDEITFKSASPLPTVFSSCLQILITFYVQPYMRKRNYNIKWGKKRDKMFFKHMNPLKLPIYDAYKTNSYSICLCLFFHISKTLNATACFAFLMSTRSVV